MKCVIYARVSSKEQEQEGFSIPAQLKLLRGYAASNGFMIAEEFVEVETAKRAGRTAFGQMLEFLGTNSDCRTILVEKTDRLYRNFRDYVELDDLGLEIHLVKENEVISKDSRSHAKFVHGIKVLLAKNYIDNLSEEVKKGMLEKAEQGEFPGKAPFGYKNDRLRKVLVPDDHYAPLVRRMYELYAGGGISLSGLRDLIYQEGWRTRTGRKMPLSLVERVLKNPIYVGEFTWRKKRYVGNHVPLVTRKLFEAVQAALRGGGGQRQGRKEFLFRGLLRCSHCGCMLVGEIKKGKYVYYHCTQARGKCEQPWIREETIDALFGDVFRSIQIDDSTISEIVRALNDSRVKEREFREKEVARLERKSADLQSKLDRAYEDRLDGTIEDGFWRDISARWREQQDQVAAQLTKFRAAHRNYIDEATEILELSKTAYSKYLKGEHSSKRKLLQLILSNCTFDGVTLYPTYKTPFDLIAEGVQNQLKRPQRESNPCYRRERAVS